uniref:calcium-binding protein n=1 Tax=Paenibacillus tengchongensis TaxID=2608684 RepID=UPI0024844364
LQDFLSVGGLLPGKLSPLFMTMYLNGMFTIGSELLNAGRALIIDQRLRLIQSMVASGLEEDAKEMFPEIYDMYEQYMNSTNTPDPVPYRDPVILDLDGNGIKASAQALGAYFDFNADGFAEKVQWVVPGDGLLVRDLNHNGAVDNGRELFGDATLLKNGGLAHDGVQALLDVDDNGDRRIDAADAVFGELQIWTDSNRDGLAAAEELHSLPELGITALDLTAVNADTLSFTYEKADGSTHLAGDLWLAASKTDTLDIVNIEIPESVLRLPNVRGYGVVRQLHVAMAQDAGLQALVEQFVTTPDYAEQKSLMEQIVLKWTASDNVSPTSRGTNIDARKLAAVEKFMAEPFVGLYGSNPGSQAAAALLGVYEGFSNVIWVQLLKQSHLKPVLERISYTVDMTAETATIGLGRVQAYLDGVLLEDKDRGLNMLKSIGILALEPSVEQQPFLDFILRYAGMNSEYALAVAETGVIRAATDGNDNLQGTEAGDTVFAMDGNDSVDGGAGDDYLSGDSGNDSLFGGAGDDRLYGGLGDDKLYGGVNSDRIEGGDGKDELFGDFGSDTLLGEDGNDMLYASEGDDVLDGGAGNDTLYGNRNNGNNSYADYNGNDTYLFGKGYGNDTIVEYGGGTGTDTIKLLDVNPGDIEVLQESGNLVLQIKETGERIAVSSYFASGSYKVESVVFTDGTAWTQAELESRVVTRGTEGNDVLYGDRNFQNRVYGFGGDDKLYGGANSDRIEGGDGKDELFGDFGSDTLLGGDGNDMLYASEGDDVLDGGAGNDTLYGNRNNGNSSYADYSGNDTYLFGKGYGNDTIVEYGGGTGTDTIKLLDVNPGDIEVLQESGNLVLQIKETGERIAVSSYFASGSYKVESVVFADGTVWTQAELESRVVTRGTEGNDVLYGDRNFQNRVYGFGGDDKLYGGVNNDRIEGGDGKDELFGDFGSDRLLGGDGNDMLYASEGDDVLDGGAGNDTLYGNRNNGNNSYADYSGNDTYLFGKGYGNDTIVEYGGGTGTDTIKLLDVNPGDIEVLQESGNLVLQIKETGERIAVSSYFASGSYKVESVVFADGTAWTQAELESRVVTRGTEGNDVLYGDRNFQNRVYGFGGDDKLYGGVNSDRIEGGDGKDELFGDFGSDTLLGGDGNDVLYASEDDDVLDGGAGNDTLYGNRNNGNNSYADYSGNDTYLFGKGYGNDTIVEYGGGTGTDMVDLKLNHDEIIVEKSGSNLLLRIAGSTDTLTVLDWKSSSSYQTEVFQAQDGWRLLNTQVDQLIQAMASFTTPQGMDWSQALSQRKEEAQQILAQYWSSNG